MADTNEVRRYADAIITLIKEDQEAGQVPRDVCSWDELDDSVDTGDYYRQAQLPVGTPEASDLRDAVNDEVGRRLAASQAGWRAPPLDELRLHQGTVWRWNRAIYDLAPDGHLRIEMRAPPAGPTVIDMLANAAFLIGMSLWLAGQDQQWTYVLPFERADHGFYRAAQQGLSAQLSWPAGHRDQIRTLAAGKLVAELVPTARQGLVEAGVATEEADELLGVISARAASGQTGAAWQHAALAAASRRYDRERALAVMLDRYLRCADTGLPVHTWPAAS